MKMFALKVLAPEFRAVPDRDRPRYWSLNLVNYAKSLVKLIQNYSPFCYLITAQPLFQKIDFLINILTFQVFAPEFRAVPDRDRLRYWSLNLVNYAKSLVKLIRNYSPFCYLITAQPLFQKIDFLMKMFALRFLPQSSGQFLIGID